MSTSPGHLFMSEGLARALLEAAGNGHAQAVYGLLKAGVDMNARDPDSGNTALFYASFMGQLQVVTALLQSNTNVDLADNRGVTPLLMAASRGFSSIVRELLLARAQTHHKSPTGLTALETAHAAGHANVVGAFRDFQQGVQQGAKTELLGAGSRVVLQGIKSSPQLNGKSGTVVDVINQGRLAVRVDGSMDPISLKKDCVKIMPAEQRSAEDEAEHCFAAVYVADAKAKASMRATKSSSNVCGHCGKEESDGERFSRCAKCVQAKVPSPAVYCSKRCQELEWPTHKLWHRKHAATLNAPKSEQYREAEERMAREAAQLVAGIPIPGGFVPTGDDADLERFSALLTPDQLEAAKAKFTETQLSYRQLIGRGTQLMQTQDLRGAEKVLKKAIKLQPMGPNAHHNIALVYQTVGNNKSASEHFMLALHALEIGLQNTESRTHQQERHWWAKVAAKAHLCVRPHAEDFFKAWPCADWRADPVQRLANAERACADAPDLHASWLMLGDAQLLWSAFEAQQRFEPREPHQDPKAARSYERAIELCDGQNLPMLHWMADFCRPRMSDQNSAVGLSAQEL